MRMTLPKAPIEKEQNDERAWKRRYALCQFKSCNTSVGLK
jgi:hypothetical protein